MAKDTFWAKITGEDVEDYLLVRFVEENVIEIEAFRGREKNYSIQLGKSASDRAKIRRIGSGDKFEICK